MREFLAATFSLAALVSLTVPGFANEVQQAQTVSLASGWNAFSLGISPSQTADEVFSSWPVDKVGYYNPAAFLDTKQYSGSTTTEGAGSTGIIMWRRGEPALSPLQHLPAGVYLCFNTNAANAAAFSTVLLGEPSAPRITWHPSGTAAAMNYIGISLANGAKTTVGEYLDGFTGGNITKSYVINGSESNKLSLVQLNSTAELADGQVVAMTCSIVSDWSGALFVSPQYGVDFSTNGDYQVISVRNDSARARNVTIEFGAASNVTTVPVPAGIMIRDTSVFTNGWVEFSQEHPFAKTLSTNETLELEVAIDRTKLSGVAGAFYGGLVTVKDATEGEYATNFRATIPLSITSDGGASSEHAWPKGLWLASATLDTVTFLEATTSDDITSVRTQDVKAGGAMQVRIPLYVEHNGEMKLLQRFVYGTDSNGVTHVYSPAKEKKFPVPIGDVKRVSSAVLPIDAPEISATNGVFGTQAVFPFTVGENSRVNPYRHVFHPSHDGLKWNFTDSTPSGDDIQNYVSTVKPEMFSVTNRITFAWDESSGTAWNPDETLSGELTWALDGVRHEGTIRMKGGFTMKRISSATLDK